MEWKRVGDRQERQEEEGLMTLLKIISENKRSMRYYSFEEKLYSILTTIIGKKEGKKKLIFLLENGRWGLKMKIKSDLDDDALNFVKTFEKLL